MSNDNDFEAAAADISERVCSVRDPQLVVTIEKWLTKLTAEDRGTNELYYLKLLQYMMANKLVGRPFVTAPPAGPLLPLSRYLNPPPLCRGRNRAGSVNSWRTSYSSRSAQTTDDEDDGDYDEAESVDADDRNGGEGGGNGVRDDASAADSAANALSTADVASAADGVGASDSAAASVPESRDGHLAGGGECSSPRCGRGRKRATAAGPENPFAKFCNPCLDGLGRHLRKARPAPLNEAYREVLGDCALPVLTESERKSVGPGLLRVLESVDGDTALQDFYFQVSLHTCDQGALLVRSSECMMNDFETLASDVFEVRAEHVSDGLAREQMSLKDKYAYLRDREMNRATVALDFLRSVCPLFDWHKYRADPDAYMRRTVAAASRDDAAQAGGGGGGGGGAEDEDEDAARQQSAAVKRLLYSLNWLRTEAARAGAEGRQLNERRAAASVQLARLNDRLAADRDRASAHVNRLKDELTLLRREEADQTALIDRRLETIQLLGQNKQASPSDAGC